MKKTASDYFLLKSLFRARTEAITQARGPSKRPNRATLRKLAVLERRAIARGLIKPETAAAEQELKALA